MEKNAKGLIRFSLVDLVLLNMHEDTTTMNLWKKLGEIYHDKSLMNKYFLRKDMHALGIEDGVSMTCSVLKLHPLAILTAFESSP